MAYLGPGTNGQFLTTGPNDRGQQRAPAQVTRPAGVDEDELARRSARLFNQAVERHMGGGRVRGMAEHVREGARGAKRDSLPPFGG
jgi:hypothetical protein